VATAGTPRLTWHGKVFAAMTEIVKLTSVEVLDLADVGSHRIIAALVGGRPAGHPHG